LTLWYAGLLTIILIALGFTLYHALRHSLMTEAINSVVVRAQQITSFIELPETSSADEETGTFIDINDPELIHRFSSDGIYIQIKDATGLLVNKSSFLPNLRLDEGNLISTLNNPGSGTLVLRNVTEIGRMIVYTVPVLRNGQPLGTVTVGRSLQFMDDALERLLLLLLFLSGGGMILAMAVGAALAKVALSPIDRITKTARQINAEGLHRRINLQGPNDEITRLANAFDEMLDRLNTSFQREQRFTADVSHELRTPLTIIKGTAEVSLRNPSSTRQDYKAALESINCEIDRMTNIADSLLTLARADAGQQHLEMNPTDFSELIEQTAAKFIPLAAKKRIALETTITAHLWINGNKERLQQLVGNLIQNAIKYTPPDGRIDLSLKDNENMVEMKIVDTGVGIPEADLPHIFERFFRVDQTRSRAEGGSGLGLSIAKWIVEAHGGQIEASSTFGSGTSILVRLPIIGNNIIVLYLP
jgi:heavy metal sensor kinase